MTQQELNNLLDEHEKWLDDRSRGSKLELRNVDLKGFRLKEKKLYLAVLENVNLDESDCERTSFSGADLNNVTFRGAILNQTDFSESKLHEVDFTDAEMYEVQIHSLINEKNLRFDNAKMDKAFFVKSALESASFKNASLREANFKRTYISHSSFENADLTKADLSYALLLNCNGTGAKIEDADFSDARELPEEWKTAINWHNEEEQLKRLIRQKLTL